jgi:hypothetical protein
MAEAWWSSVSGGGLAQGDLLPSCALPVFLDPIPQADNEATDVDVYTQRLIVVTQSCDLENNKVEFVALCPIHTLDEFAETNPHYKNKKNWEAVRRGQVHALHLIASPEAPYDNVRAYVVDFGHIVSLPIKYLEHHAGKMDSRWRLMSPFLEHFSQALARFFMRVGLPSGISPFR